MGGKSSAPAAPDYIGQANATAAGNLAAARSQTTANRINQVTPYGSLTYTNGQTFNQGGYDAAVAKYQQDLAAAQASRNAFATSGRAPGTPDWMQSDATTWGMNPGATQQQLDQFAPLPSAPTRDQFLVGNPDQWSSEIKLSDTGQQLLDADSRARLRLAGLTDQAIDRVGSTLNGNDLNASTGMQGWDKYSDLLMQRLNPGLDQQQAALDTKLANQGLTAGSEGWGTQQQQFGKQRNDAGVAAQLAGAQLQQQMFQQQAYLRNLPINELNALRSGSAVTNPTFSTPGQQGQTSGPDLMGASQASYNAALGNTNAQNAASAQTTQAGIGLLALGAAAFF